MLSNFVHHKTTIILKKTPTAKRGRKHMFIQIRWLQEA